MSAFRRAVRIALFSCFVIATSVPADAAAASLVVRRAPGDSSGASRLRPLATSPVSPGSIASQLAAKRERWKSFPDLLIRPGADLSPNAHRRRGWRGPGVAPRRTPLDVAGASEPAAAAEALTDTIIRVAIIRIDFAADRGGTASTGDGHFDLSRPGSAAVPIDRPPHDRAFYLDHLEALRRYYDAQSYHRVVVEGDVWPRTANGAYSCSDMADFGPWEFSPNIFDAAVAMFRSMLFAADTQSTQMGDRIPWDQYDRFVIVHAGADLQSDVRRDSPEDIPSFTITVDDTDAVIFRDSTAWNRENPIDRAAFIPETVNQDDYFGAINGVIAHECGHLFFGFVDLYNTETGFPVVGLWSLMDSGNLVGSIVVLPDQSEIFATGLLPPSIDPWQRFYTTDRLTFPEVAYGDTLAYRNGERHPDMRRVSLTSDEYLLLENRYQAPADSVELDQADSSRVVLGPKKPDRFEYDALLPGGGMLVWHIDESVIPINETTYPCDSARANPGCGFNSDPRRLAISVIEADGLADLGDLNSPFILGSPSDPWPQPLSISLGDSTHPNLIPHIGTQPHIRLDFLGAADSTMRVAAFRTWQLPGWPIQASFPPGGPQPLAIDVDGDRLPEVCWAGGPADSTDSASVFVVRASGHGLFGPSPVFSTALDRRPNPLIAAISRGGELATGPSVLAVTTFAAGADTSQPGGRIWLLDSTGQPVAGWPVRLPSIVTTPPVIASAFRDTFVYVGCADGRVYALALDGSLVTTSDPPLTGGITGRLAVFSEPIATNSGDAFVVAAGGADGDVGVFAHPLPPGSGMLPLPTWPQHVGGAGVPPDFLWLDFGGARAPGSSPSTADSDCFRGALTLVVHRADMLWAYCLSGRLVDGWGRSVGDTIVAGLAAGDVDGDGFPELITQSVTSRVTYFSVDGHPSPGWPKPGTLERFRSEAAPLTADLESRHLTQAISSNASGIVDAFDASGRQPLGWPLATGLDATGSPLLADLNGDHYLELVVPDARGRLYAYTLPTRDSALVGTSWPMVGGDPQRTSALPIQRTPATPQASAGPLVRGSLKAYPNPARRAPVSFAYRLTEPGQVEFRIVDTSGHQVAAFTRRARQAENVEVWDPGALPAGLYVARLKFRGATSEAVETLPVGLLR